MDNLILRNGALSATFAAIGETGYRPEWIRTGERPALRFKDHEWLNVGGTRVTSGQLVRQSELGIEFGGTVLFGGETVEWSVTITIPEDDGPGFRISSRIAPLAEPIEVLEALSTFETPYEYDGAEDSMTVMAQQPVYHWRDGQQITGAGYQHPFWYYERAGSAHLTFPSSSPLLVHRIAALDGSNERVTVVLGDWQRCSFKDMMVMPTRRLREGEAEPFRIDGLRTAPGLHGAKFLIGAANWHTSLHKDPNYLVEPGVGVTQELVIDCRVSLDGSGGWDGILADSWERLASIHWPGDGKVPAYDVAKSQGASWTAAADWLANEFASSEGKVGLFNPEHGPYVYAPNTRPRWDHGVELFSGQWTGPLALLSKVWDQPGYLEAANRLDALFTSDKNHPAKSLWVIGPTPQYVSVLRMAQVAGVSDGAREKIDDYLRSRVEMLLDPAEGADRPDGGVLAWDAYAHLLAATLWDRQYHESVARQMILQANTRLDDRFWSFNCAADFATVGGGQGRPFGHGMAASVNAVAYQRFGDPAFLRAAERFGNLLLAMHYIVYNDSQSPDYDTRGWANGSNGGRDQWGRTPPWETGTGLQQIAHLIEVGKARPGHYDALWMFSRTGLAQFPAARTLKRLYRPDLSVVYRPIDSLPTERAFYRSLPYLAYEEPWDQTMLAPYQGAEPIVQSLFFGGGLVAADDDRILAVAPGAVTYDSNLAKTVRVQLWNPTSEEIETTLTATAAVRRKIGFHYSGSASGVGTWEQPRTAPVTVPPRKVVELIFDFEPAS